MGASLGVAISGSILAANLHGPLRARFVPASHAGWLLLAGCGAAIMVVALVTNGRGAPRTADPISARDDPHDERTPAMTPLRALPIAHLPKSESAAGAPP